jgi:hypothetical protein
MSACEENPKAMARFCASNANRDEVDRCVSACIEAYWRALQRPANPTQRADFDRALRACVERRDAGGGVEPCAFRPALDPVDLDQVRCNARCDEIAADHRRERLRNLSP